MSRIIRIGVVGCGCISGIYLHNMTRLFKEIEVAGVCDLIRERAEKQAAAYGIKRIYKDMHEMYADPSVDLILNITRPYQHYEVTKAALEAGKHVFTEKPLGASFEEGLALVKLAEEKGLMLGGAPDTFMGAGIQTCRRLIDDGYIGRPVAASAFFLGHGPENWHPDPDFFYQRGGGPMFDMGPYYATTLINLLGGVKSVSAVCGRAFDNRMATCNEHFGENIEVNISTHYSGTLLFESGVIATMAASFDVYSHTHPHIEIYGTEGTLSVPDPNTFGGSPRLWRPEDKAWRDLPLLYPYPENARGLGITDMAKTIAEGGESVRRCRATHRQTLHVLEILCAFQKSSDTGAAYQMATKYERERPMNAEYAYGILD